MPAYVALVSGPRSLLAPLRWPGQAYRLLFAPEGRHGQVLLALEAFSKKTHKTPPAKIDQAERRLVEWRKRGTQS